MRQDGRTLALFFNLTNSTFNQGHQAHFSPFYTACAVIIPGCLVSNTLRQNLLQFKSQHRNAAFWQLFDIIASTQIAGWNITMMSMCCHQCDVSFSIRIRMWRHVRWKLEALCTCALGVAVCMAPFTVARSACRRRCGGEISDWIQRLQAPALPLISPPHLSWPLYCCFAAAQLGHKDIVLSASLHQPYLSSDPSFCVSVGARHHHSVCRISSGFLFHLCILLPPSSPSVFCLNRPELFKAMFILKNGSSFFHLFSQMANR